MLFSQKLLRRTLGMLWLLDAILQVQSPMFTSDMIHSALLPTLSTQPVSIAVSFHMIILMIAQHLVFFNLLIVLVQVEIGIFSIASVWVRETMILFLAWMLIVWYGGKSMNMLFTGRASVLTGMPGAVLLYPVPGLLICPRKGQSLANGAERLISRMHFRWVLASFWIFAALLQLQPFWWQKAQIAQVIGSMTSMGKLDAILVDPVRVLLARLMVPFEVPLNSVLIVVFLGLGSSLALIKPQRSRPLLVLSILLSLLTWWTAQCFGMILTGQAADFNSGLLMVLMTLACWPKTPSVPQDAAQDPNQVSPVMKQLESAAPLAVPAIS